MAVAFEKLSPQDFGTTPCPNYHWGFLFKGTMVVRYADREETIEDGQAFYMEPGHLRKVVEACEEVVFTPSAPLTRAAKGRTSQHASDGSVQLTHPRTPRDHSGDG